MRLKILVTAVLLVGLLASSGAGVAVASHTTPDAGASAPADGDVSPDCVDEDGDGDCEWCYTGDGWVRC